MTLYICFFSEFLGPQFQLQIKNISQPLFSCSFYMYVDDFSRVKLTTLPGEEGSDYINASFLDVSIMWQIHCMYMGLPLSNHILICLTPQCRDIIVRGHTLLHKVGFDCYQFCHAISNVHT